MPGNRSSLVLGPVAALLLVLAAAAGAASQVPGPRVSPPPAPTGAAGLWVSDSPLEDGRRLLVVVDPVTRHAAVYHLDSASGGLTLKSARDLTWDLSIDEFNSREPRPAALRKMLQAPPVSDP
jgi:hypothetical protein